MNKSWLHLEVPCRILTRSKSAQERLRRMEQRFFSDGIDPLKYECADCGCAWGDAVLTDYGEVVCSNCYSDRVLVVAVRLNRYEAALAKVRRPAGYNALQAVPFSNVLASSKDPGSDAAPFQGGRR